MGLLLRGKPALQVSGALRVEAVTPKCIQLPGHHPQGPRSDQCPAPTPQGATREEASIYPVWKGHWGWLPWERTVPLRTAGSLWWCCYCHLNRILNQFLIADFCRDRDPKPGSLSPYVISILCQFLSIFFSLVKFGPPPPRHCDLTEFLNMREMYLIY